MQAFREFMNYFSFLYELFKRDFKKKYYKSVLGVVWTLLNPLLMMTVMTIVFSTLFRRSIEYFPVYYLCGYVMMSFNSMTTTQSLNCILNNSGLIRKIHVPNYMFCLATVGVNAFTMVISLIPMFLMILVTGAPVTPYLLLIPVPLILLLIFTTGLSVALSITGVFFRDMKHLYSIITTVWMYATPTFYPISIIPQQYRFIWDLNPLYHYITMMRNLVLYRTIPSQQTLFIATCYSLLMLVTGILVFKKYQDRIYTHL